MTSLLLVVALIAFLSGATSAVFLMLFIGIRKGDRPERVQGSRKAPARRLHPYRARHLDLAERPGLPPRPRRPLTREAPGSQP